MNLKYFINSVTKRTSVYISLNWEPNSKNKSVGQYNNDQTIKKNLRTNTDYILKTLVFAKWNNW